CSRSRIGDGASVRAATRVNAEQASKRSMCRPTRLQFRGRLIRLGEMSEDDAQSLHRGTGGSTYTRKARATREAPKRLCQSNGRSSTHGAARPDRSGHLGREGAPLGQRAGSSLFVNFAGDEMALLIEMVVDLSMNWAEFLQRLHASKPL